VKPIGERLQEEFQAAAIPIERFKAVEDCGGPFDRRSRPHMAILRRLVTPACTGRSGLGLRFEIALHESG
jgi:hypothetical protein